MTASAQLGNRSAAQREDVLPSTARPARLAVLGRPLPAPPTLAPPTPMRLLTPAAPGQWMPAPVGCRVLRPAALARPCVLRSRRLAHWVAAATVTLAVVGGLGWIGQGASPGIPTQTAVARVGAGETLWDVARRVAPQSDQRAIVERIRQLNGIVGSAVAPGQQLQVPHGL